MARLIRFQYPGAIYHVMARRDDGRTVFETDDDRKSFMFRIGIRFCLEVWPQT